MPLAVGLHVCKNFTSTIKKWILVKRSKRKISWARIRNAHVTQVPHAIKKFEIFSVKTWEIPRKM